jgi:iron(III) transport system substrate-binding protein
MSKKLFVISAALLVLWPTAARAAEPAALQKLIAAAKAEKEFTLLGGGGVWGDAEAQKKIENGFNKHFGLNVRIKFIPGPAMPDLARRIADEYKAGQKSASDMYLGSESHFVELTRSDALRSFNWREAFPNIPSAMVEMDGRLLREATRYIGVSYNRQAVQEKELPKQLNDLLDPKWKGRIASTPYAASFDRLASVIGPEKTREFLKRFTQNVAGLIRCGEEERIASGEFVMLALNCGTYEAERAQRQGMPVNARILSDVPIVGYWYVSVPKHSAHPNMATLFAGYLLTPEGQKVRFDSIGATAHLIEGTPANKQYKELKAQGIELKDFTADFVIKNGKMLGERRDEFQKILQQR